MDRLPQETQNMPLAFKRTMVYKSDLGRGRKISIGVEAYSKGVSW